VPLEVAEIVATHAREVLLVDMRKRARHFAELGFEPDDSVDVAKMEQYFARLDAVASKA
jgi:hypothetical protein